MWGTQIIQGNGESKLEAKTASCGRLSCLLRLKGGSDGKESTCNVGDPGSIPGLGRSPGGGHGNPLQYYCLENLYGQRSLVGYSQWGCKEPHTTEQLSTAQQHSSCRETAMLRNKSHHLLKTRIFPHHYQCILHCHGCSQLCPLLFQHTTAQQRIFTQNDHVALLSFAFHLSMLLTSLLLPSFLAKFPHLLGLPLVVVVFSHSVMFYSFATPHHAPLSWDFPGKNTGVGYHFLLQEIFLTQGSNL